MLMPQEPSGTRFPLSIRREASCRAIYQQEVYKQRYFGKTSEVVVQYSSIISTVNRIVLEVLFGEVVNPEQKRSPKNAAVFTNRNSVDA
jgi:hypothetical protein